MIRKLNIEHLLLKDKNVITFNVNGKLMTNEKLTFNQLSNLNIEKFISSEIITNKDDKSDLFIDHNPKLFEYFIKKLRRNSFKTKCNSDLILNQQINSFEEILNNFKLCLSK